MFVQQHVCAQQIYACAQSLKFVSARAQLRGNTNFNFLLLNWTKLDLGKVVYTFIYRKQKLKVYQTKKCKNQK